MAIDVNRGVMYKRSTAAGNISVYMYLDQPGIYLDEHENEVSEDIAKMAGYPIDKYAKERLRQTKMKAAMDAIEQELDFDAAEVEQLEVLAEDKGFRVVAMPLGNAHILDDDGNQLTPVPVAREQAMFLFAKLTGTTEKPKTTKNETVPKK